MRFLAVGPPLHPGSQSTASCVAAGEVLLQLQLCGGRYIYCFIGPVNVGKCIYILFPAIYSEYSLASCLCSPLVGGGMGINHVDALD